MALIPVQHVVADMFAVDPDWSFAIDGTISAGQFVVLDANGYVQLQTVAGARPIGIAGDNLQDHGPNSPFGASLVIGANGAQAKATENRVSDSFNETLASGKLTVYRSGGRFLTDQFADVAYVNGGLLYSNNAGLVTSAAGAGVVAAICAAAPGAYPSGVPGTDVSGSMSLGTYIDILLQV